MTDDSEQLTQLIRDIVARDALTNAVFSKPADRAAQVVRIDVRPIRLQGRLTYQFASRTDRQELHRNRSPDQAVEEMITLAKDTFRDVRLQSRDATWTARRSRKGVCSLKRQVQNHADEVIAAAELPDHDRGRQYLIPDGVPVPFLVATGIMSPDGKVRAKHFKKFRQINRYVEFIRDIADRLPESCRLNVVDFGCGKSYLTFATHHLLTSVLRREVDITGLDCRQDVVETCRSIADELKLPGLNFAVGQIADYDPSAPVHLAISLHACDTATDDSLAKAVSWGCGVILAVPCCQHELAEKLPRDVQPLLSRHGILHERFCAMATDAVRAAVLERAGYSTVVQEFIDMQHTPKNVLIRAVRRVATDRPRDADGAAEHLRLFCEAFGLPVLSLQRQLEEYGLLPAR